MAFIKYFLIILHKSIVWIVAQKLFYRIQVVNIVGQWSHIDLKLNKLMDKAMSNMMYAHQKMGSLLCPNVFDLTFNKIPIW